VHLVGFIMKKFVTMQHGHANVKFVLFISMHNVIYMGLVTDCKKLQGLLRKGRGQQFARNRSSRSTFNTAPPNAPEFPRSHIVQQDKAAMRIGPIDQLLQLYTVQAGLPIPNSPTIQKAVQCTLFLSSLRWYLVLLRLTGHFTLT
jgi:hypothetical protein